MFWTDPSFLTIAMIVALAIQWIPVRKSPSVPSRIRITDDRVKKESPEEE